VTTLRTSNAPARVLSVAALLDAVRKAKATLRGEGDEITARDGAGNVVRLTLRGGRWTR